MLWLALSCGFSYVAIRFRPTRGENDAYAQFPAPNWLAPFGITCVVIGVVLLAWALAWPLHTTEDRARLSTTPDWVVWLFLLGPFDAIALTTAVTADNANSWQPPLLAVTCTAVLVLGRSLWDPTREKSTDGSTPS